MSHFKVLVFTRENEGTVDDLLAPFDENIEYEPYIKYTREQAIEKVRKDIEEYKNTIYAEYLADPQKYKEKYGNNLSHIDYLKNKFPLKLKWSDNECYEYEKQWFDEEMVDEDGNLLSTYNPKSKWDWYTIGGRWDDELKLVSGELVNEAYVSEIDWRDNIPFAFITPDGEWHEKGNMGWWACVSNEKKKNDWETEFKDFINNLDDDVIVTVVDCHI